MIGHAPDRAAGERRRRRQEPPKGEQTVAEIGKEYIHDDAVRRCR